MSNVYTVYRKELLDTLRDGKTLVFMLLLPTVLVPVLMMVMGNLALSFAVGQVTRTAVVAAGEEDQAAYRQLVHETFLGSELGRLLTVAHSPLVLYFGGGAVRQLVGQLPTGALSDPEAFHAWTTGLARQVNEAARGGLSGKPDGIGGLEGVDLSGLSRSLEGSGGTSGLQGALLEFYQVAIRGLGMIEFVDPAELDPAGDLAQEEVPAGLRGDPHGAAIVEALRSRRIQGALTVDFPDADPARSPDATVRLGFYHDLSEPHSLEANLRIRTVADHARQSYIRSRIRNAGLPPSILTPVEVKSGTNIASGAEVLIGVLGGLLPYLVVAFAFIGALYPALDLGAGEKERQTLETLLLSPATRTEIALGKFLLIFTTSLVAALAGVLSMLLSVVYLAPGPLMQMLEWDLDPGRMVALAVLAVPPAAAFAGLFLTVSIFARSFKEAQNYMGPVSLVLILPAGAGLIPGIELTAGLALVPIVNVSLLSKSILGGEPFLGYFLLSLLSCVAFAGVCLALCVAMFQREGVLFRN